MNVHVYIQNGQTIYEPAVEGSITWETQRKGQPGKCSFTVISDGKLKIEEGNAVRLDVNGKPVFFGFIFERSWSRDGEVKVTAYDQLRYLKNKDSYNYENKTVGEVIQMIAGDFNLQTGVLEDTGHRIPTRNEPDTTLFDIILNALDLTLIATGRMYVLYDDVGKLTLRNAEDMKLNVMIDDETAQDYDFTVSIDKDTYNQIKLFRENDDTKKRDVFMTKHTENINKWGVLQMSESLDKGGTRPRRNKRGLFLNSRSSLYFRHKLYTSIMSRIPTFRPSSKAVFSHAQHTVPCRSMIFSQSGILSPM